MKKQCQQEMKTRRPSPANLVRSDAPSHIGKYFQYYECQVHREAFQSWNKIADTHDGSVFGRADSHITVFQIEGIPRERRRTEQTPRERHPKGCSV